MLPCGSRTVATLTALIGITGLTSVRADELTDVKSFQLEVSGTIAQHCAMGDIANLELGNLESTARTRTTNVALNCNMPIEVSVSAANGGLANTLYPQGQGPYVGKLAYDLGFVMPVRRPDESVVSHTFTSAQLLGGQNFSSNDGIAVDGMQLTLDLAATDREGPNPLLGGNYTETIEITITPS
jgi:hypothetical protein